MMKPYISFVATSRNDNHGENLLNRMQIFVNGLIAQCTRHNLHCELILVEWNPPSNQPSIIEVLSFPRNSSHCKIRIIEVPNSIHSKFRHSQTLPLFQMIAKNVGIKRSEAEFIVATNIDLLFSDQLISFLSRRKLDKHKFYRVDRYDVDSNISPEWSIDEQLLYCQKHTIRICERNGIRDLKNGEYLPIFSVLPSRPEKLRHFAYRIHRYLNWRPLWLRQLWLPTFYPRLHTNGCGDFTLMSRDAWFQLGGYPELEIFSFHLDSLLCYMAYWLGLKEVVLPSCFCVYHIDHKGGWSPDVEKDKSIDNRLNSESIPRLHSDDFENFIKLMRLNRSPLVFNNESWGIADECFKETTF